MGPNSSWEELVCELGYSSWRFTPASSFKRIFPTALCEIQRAEKNSRRGGGGGGGGGGNGGLKQLELEFFVVWCVLVAGRLRALSKRIKPLIQ